MAKVRVAGTGDVPVGEGRTVEAGGRAIALFNVAGTFYALDNVCIHRGAPLGDGDLDGTFVSCPWHAWRWDVRTGAHANNPAVKIACFPVTVQGTDVFVEVP